MDEKIFNSIDKNNSRSRVKKFRRIWDFVCVSNDGRVFHFSKISRLITFSVFLMFLLTVYSGVLSWFYLLDRKNLQILTENYIETEHKLQDVSRERDSAVAKLALAGEPEKKDLPVSEKPAQSVMKVEPALPAPAEEKTVQGENQIVSNGVTLENFSAKKSKGNGLNIRFSVKPKTDEKILKGYIFSALMPDSESPSSKWKIFPKSERLKRTLERTSYPFLNLKQREMGIYRGWIL